MQKLTCTGCGSTQFIQGNNMLICHGCGSWYVVPRDPDITVDLVVINRSGGVNIDGPAVINGNVTGGDSYIIIVDENGHSHKRKV